MSTSTTVQLPTRPPLFSFRSIRLRIALLLMYGMFCNLSLRSNLGVTMVCMVNSTVTSKPKPSHNASYDSCPSQTTEEQHEPSGYDGTLLWDAHLQGLMFSATSFGSFLILVPAGILADKFSARIIAFIGVSLAGLATYALPFIAQHFTYGFIGLRFIIGGSLGMIIPALASIASRWFVPDERATLSAIYTSGAQISGIFLGLVAPYLCSLKEIGGWVSVYYLCAFLALVWGFLWLVFASNYAEKNRSISDGEKLYITNNVIPRKGRKSGIFPWKSAFTSLPFISILVVRVTGLIQHQILQYYAATFIRDVLHTDIYRNGLFIALPHLTDLIPKMLFSTLADLLKRRKITGYTASVRLFQSIGCFGSACCFAGLVFLADCNRVIPAVALLGLSGVFASFVSPGANTSALSIAPMYTGTIHSIDMLIGFLLASGSVYLTGIVIHKMPSTAWTIVFSSIAGMNVFAGVLFGLFGSAEVQKWAEQKDKTENSYDSTRLSELSASIGSTTTVVT
ncbi:hypothetical protein QR680_015854 [Steinernema hermaphroditum]|uniref:Major facilitator superfamily (MFS) profile domain-containing protein n=1 Tax=Steinernema hermaphroditum TaxID=289476 RepID=A0AA39H9G4_9BILA|nr:hypothetical protein QR680_015854 [Steinernema hermaphroditum]